MSKIYCGIGKVPKNYKKGTMKECVEQKQVRLYGLYKIDPILLNAKSKPSSKEKKMGQNELRAYTYKLKGRFQKLKDNYDHTEDKDKKSEIKKELVSTKKLHDHYVLVLKKLGTNEKVSVKTVDTDKENSKKSTKKTTKKETTPKKTTKKETTPKKTTKKETTPKKTTKKTTKK